MSLHWVGALLCVCDILHPAVLAGEEPWSCMELMYVSLQAFLDSLFALCVCWSLLGICARVNSVQSAEDLDKLD